MITLEYSPQSHGPEALMSLDCRRLGTLQLSLTQLTPHVESLRLGLEFFRPRTRCARYATSLV